MTGLSGINKMSILYTSQYKDTQPKKENKIKTVPRKVETVLKSNGGGQHFDSKA